MKGNFSCDHDMRRVTKQNSQINVIQYDSLLDLVPMFNRINHKNLHSKIFRG